MHKQGGVKFEKAYYAEFISTGSTHVVVHGLLVDANYSGSLTVGDSLLLIHTIINVEILILLQFPSTKA